MSISLEARAGALFSAPALTSTLLRLTLDAHQRAEESLKPTIAGAPR